jgi:hypothetical protein
MLNVRFRQMSARERLVDTLRQSGLVNYRFLSRLHGRPSKEAASGSSAEVVCWRFPSTPQKHPQPQKMNETAVRDK